MFCKCQVNIQDTMTPKLIKGSLHQDDRGKLLFNNNFDATLVKRFYIIENHNIDFKRGWQGHRLEQRWFSAVQGSFIISLIKIDNWENPSKNAEKTTFFINDLELNVLNIPKGYISCIQSTTMNSKLIVFADYLLGELNDEYRYDIDYFQ